VLNSTILYIYMLFIILPNQLIHLVHTTNPVCSPMTRGRLRPVHISDPTCISDLMRVTHPPAPVSVLTQSSRDRGSHMLNHFLTVLNYFASTLSHYIIFVSHFTVMLSYFTILLSHFIIFVSHFTIVFSHFYDFVSYL
jgi:hypothetical protein